MLLYLFSLRNRPVWFPFDFYLPVRAESNNVFGICPPWGSLEVSTWESPAVISPFLSHPPPPLPENVSFSTAKRHFGTKKMELLPLKCTSGLRKRVGKNFFRKKKNRSSLSPSNYWKQHCWWIAELQWKLTHWLAKWTGQGYSSMRAANALEQSKGKVKVSGDALVILNPQAEHVPLRLSIQIARKLSIFFLSMNLSLWCKISVFITTFQHPIGNTLFRPAGRTQQ